MKNKKGLFQCIGYRQILQQRKNTILISPAEKEWSQISKK